MRWKLDFTGEGSPPQRNAWFVWRRDWSGPPMQMRFMNREDGNALGQDPFDFALTPNGRGEAECEGGKK